MEIIKTAIEGFVIIEPRLFKDDRGYFFESFSQREFTEKAAYIVRTTACTYHWEFFFQTTLIIPVSYTHLDVYKRQLTISLTSL